MTRKLLPFEKTAHSPMAKPVVLGNSWSTGRDSNWEMGVAPPRSSLQIHVSRCMVAGSMLIIGMNSTAAYADTSLRRPLAEIEVKDRSGSAFTSNNQANSPESGAKWRRLFAFLDIWSSQDDEGRNLAARSIEILRDVNLAGILPPRLTREDDGEIDLVWERGESYTSISLALDGNLIAYHHSALLMQPIRIDEPFSFETLMRFRKDAQLA